MSPIHTMILSGVASAAAAAAAMVSGVTFKRAYDEYSQTRSDQALLRQVPKHADKKSQTESVAPSSGLGEPNRQRTQVKVREVSSVDQRGGVTAAFVDTVNQNSSR